MIDLYKNIKRLRLENQWSQGELAKRAGYKDRSAIAHIEDGRIDLPQSKIKLFADIFGVTPSYLFGDSGCSGSLSLSVSVEEANIIKGYRSSDDSTKTAVCAVLGVKRQEEQRLSDSRLDA